MGSWSCIHGSSLESDRLGMVRRLPGRNRSLTERRLVRHLWAQLPDGPRRRTTRSARDDIPGPDFGGPTPGPGSCGGFADLFSRHNRHDPIVDLTERRHRDVAADRAALDTSKNEVGPRRRRSELSPPS